MESNTFATSTFIATEMEPAFDYLKDLRNLDEWTLYSRMIEQVDENTWRGTASGYQHDLYYHVRPIDTPSFKGVEWHCGYEPGEYFQCYPAFLFPSGYVGKPADGVFFHWLSFVGPERRTPMIMQGIDLVHTAEIRSLKAALERRAGHAEAQRAPQEIQTSSIFVDAELADAVAFLGDLRNFPEWAYFIRERGAVSPNRGEFSDEYDQPVEVSAEVHDMGAWAIIEFAHHYRRNNAVGAVQRNVMVLVPCAYAFGNPRARGLVQHRVAFFDRYAPRRFGRLQIEDYGAESMSLKRVLEKRAGNLGSFGRGGSYEPDMLRGAEAAE